MNWFLYDRDLRHERVKMLFAHHAPKVCSYILLSKISFFFFLSGFSFTNVHIQRTAGKVGGYLLIYHFLPLHSHLDISRVIAAERSLLHIAGIQIRTGNLWFPNTSCLPLTYMPFKIFSVYTCTGSSVARGILKT